MRKRPVIYLIGSYSADNPEIFNNMRRGMRVAYAMVKAGFAPIVPWFDYQLSSQGDVFIEEYYEWGLSLMSKADACVVLPDYETSKGSLAEIESARIQGIVVFYLQSITAVGVIQLEDELRVYFQDKGLRENATNHA